MSTAMVGCAGIIVADLFCGPMDALPAPGELLSIDSMPAGTGGCAANVAIDLAAQGIPSRLFGTLGQDATAEGVIADLMSKGIDCRSIGRHAQLPTSTTVILLVKGQDRRYIHAFGANRAFGVESIARDALEGLRVFYLGGLGVLPAMDTAALGALLEECRHRGIVTVVDVVLPRGDGGFDAYRPLMPHIDYFMPNRDEAAQMTGLEEPEKQADCFIDAGVKTAIITLGAEGAYACSGETYWRIESPQMQCIDPSGSGDAFCSGIITGVVRGWEMSRMLRYAVALGASATRSIGTTTSVFTAAEAKSFIESHSLTLHTGRRQRT